MKFLRSFFILAALFLHCEGKVFAQKNKPAIGIYAGSGLSLGWWIYQHGFSNNGDSGWDKTHLSLVFPVEGYVTYQSSNWSLAAGVQYTLLNDDVMIGSNDRRGNRVRYFINEKDKPVPITKYHLQFTWSIFQSKKIRLGPMIRAGTFSIATLHPRKDDFGFKGFLDWGISSQITVFPNLDLNIMPIYSNMAIFQKNPINPQERHRIYNLGVLFGLTGWIVK